MNSSGPPSRFRPDTTAAIISLAEKGGPIANDEVRVFWSDDDGWKVEPRRDALLRCIGNADFAIQIAIVQSVEPTRKQARQVLEKVARALEKAHANLAVLFGEAASRDLDSVKLAMLDSTDRIAERLGGFSHFQKFEWPLPAGNPSVPDQRKQWTDYQSQNFLIDLCRDIGYAAEAAANAARSYETVLEETERQDDLGPKSPLAVALAQVDPTNAALAMVHAAWVHVLERPPIVKVDRVSGISGGAYLEFVVGILQLMGFKSIGTDAARSRLRNMALI